MNAPAPPDVRTRILAEATRLFAQRGFEGASIQAVASAVGIRKPSLLYWFPSKDALRDAVLEQLLSHWKDDLPRALAASSSGKDRLHSSLSALMEFFRQDPCRATLLVREMLDRPDAMRDLFRAHLQPWTRLVTDTIRMGQETGRVHADLDPEAWVMQLVTMAVGTIATGPVTAAMLAGAEDATVERQLHELVRIARTSLFNARPAPDSRGHAHPGEEA